MNSASAWSAFLPTSSTATLNALTALLSCSVAALAYMRESASGITMSTPGLCRTSKS